MNRDIRADFPILSRKIDGLPIIYLDSAATSLKPIATMKAERSYSTRYTENVHRGVSVVAEEASYHYEAARRRIARFIGADPASVIMTPNTSYAISMIAHGLGLKPEDKVLCSPNSHHSNLLPWIRRGRVTYIEGDPLLPVDPDAVRRSIEQHHPRLLAFGWVSNVNGVVSPAADICRVARQHDVLSVVDAAQAAPHLTMDVDALDCDFLAFSGHKLLGPTGTGVLWGRRHILEKLEPLVVAGGTVDRVTLQGYRLKRLPHRLEAGTPNIAGVIGLGAAVEYLESIGREWIATKERELCDAMTEALVDLKGVRILKASPGTAQIAMASVVPLSPGLSSDTLCRALSDRFRIVARSGFHCAHPLFDSHAFRGGAVRLSAYIYNSAQEIREAGNALHTILRRLAV